MLRGEPSDPGIDSQTAYHIALKMALEDLYAEEVNLSEEELSETTPKVQGKTFLNAIKTVFKKKGYNPEMLSDPTVTKLIKETYTVYQQAISKGFQLANNQVPEAMATKLDHDAFIFSGFKTHNEISEVGLSLRDKEGNVKPFETFKQDVQKVHEAYNVRYLKAEYQFAVTSSQMAAKWADVAKDGDRYNLQYRTAGDNRVRDEHAALDGVTLPPSDGFWSSYYPPNMWMCRCTAVQVSKYKYEKSDSTQAIADGERATTKLDRFGNNKAAIFRFNPGQQEKVFPPKHPYYKAGKEAKKCVDSVVRKDRFNKMLAEMPNNLTNDEKIAIANNNIALEKAIHLTKRKTMSTEEADKQNANPNFGKLKGTDINCQTCVPAYALRCRGFDIWAKPNTKGSKLEYLSKGVNVFEVWKNADGTSVRHTSINEWLAEKKYNKMTPKRYNQFFNEVCNKEGIYQLSIGWKRGSGHTTILQKFPNGELRYIEPQCDNSKGSGREWSNIDFLCRNGSTIPHVCRGILRIDNKLFNLDFAEILDK